MAGYYDEIADLMSDATSPLENPDEEEQGTSALQKAGAPSAQQGTGRYSENGNELPEGLQSRVAGNPPQDGNGTPSPVASTPATVNATGTSTVAPGGGGATPDDLASYANQGFKGELRNLAKGDTTVDQMANQPTEEQVTAPLQRRLDQAQTPVSPNQKAYDPSQPIGPGNQPGQENYRPTVGQRVLRGVEAYARRGVMGPVDPGAAGVKPYGAPNDDYDREVARRANAAKNLQDQMKQQVAAYKERQTQLKNTAEAQQAQSTGYSRLPTGVTGQQNAASEALNAKTASDREKNQTPEAQAAVAAAKATAAMEARRKSPVLKTLTPTNQQLYIINGRIPDPRQATAEEIAAGRALDLFKKENGRGPKTMQEYADIQASARGQETPTQRSKEKSNRDDIRTSTTQLTQSSRALLNAQKAYNTNFDKTKKADLKKAVDDAQAAYDKAEAKMNSFAQPKDEGSDETVPAAVKNTIPPAAPTVPATIPGKQEKIAAPPSSRFEAYSKDGNTLLGHYVGPAGLPKEELEWVPLGKKPTGKLPKKTGKK